ncbi:hypothetical protein DAEQUDRAFT_713142 [Daedalea quercina L-15889]|uniref:Methyltransferase domain-containing protein n=1 Tax=Daedalea quercina L-15889 TaxID=1314783 RepID=A0A165P0S4_9APHY|nr:hypothetical protein DAEQUDRAFT_713142 [Daedalea quercina L-15889]
MSEVNEESRRIFEETYSTLDEEARAFLTSRTGISNEAQLKEHILQVQASAFGVHKYRCIQNYSFLKLKTSRLPAYGQLLKLGRERKGAIFLDIGCCFGNDIRKAVVDGFPIQNVIGSDLYPAFWELGHKLFKDTPETFPVPFIAGDALSPAFLQPSPPAYSPPSTPPPDHASLKEAGTLTPLLGHVSAIHASSFFHLFNEAQQATLARAVAGLLSPEPGSVIFGSHGGRSKKGLRGEVAQGLWRTEPMWCHDPESWKALWDGEVFEKGTVRVEAVLKEGHSRRVGIAEDGGIPGSLVWSVTRL